MMGGLHNNVITMYTDLMTRRFILAAIWNKIFPASIRKDTLHQHDQDTKSKSVFLYLHFCKYEDMNTALK